MVKGVILVDYTDQGRRTIKDSPDRAEASKAEAAKLGINVRELNRNRRVALRAYSNLSGARRHPAPAAAEDFTGLLAGDRRLDGPVIEGRQPLGIEPPQ